MNIIGLTGKKRHGKDTVGRLIQKYSTRRIVMLSFAKPIKQALSFIHCVPMEYFEDDNLKESPLEDWDNRTPRQLAQWLGTDVYREQFDSNIWLKNMEIRIRKNYKPDTLVVITDCRFDNEAEFVKSFGGQIWNIDASVRKGISGDSHVSENGINPIHFDENIDNNGTIEQLDEQIKNLIE